MATETGFIQFVEGSVPSTPSTGKWRIYTKTTGLFIVDDAGTEYGPLAADGAAAHIADATDAHDASAVSFDPSGLSNTAATELQTAMEDYDAAIDSAGGAGLGAWTDFTPTITAASGGFALGDGLLQGRYKQLDAATYAIAIFYRRGSTTTNGTGIYSIALPVTAKATKPAVQILHGHLLDAGTAYFVGAGFITQNTASVAHIITADGSGARQASHNTPFTWATGDEFSLFGILEV